MAEASFLTVRLLQEFDRIEPVNDVTNIRQYLSITLEPVDKVMLYLRKAR